MLLLPQGADQYVFSDRVVRAGACQRLLPDAVNPDGIRTSLVSLLSDADYRNAARRLQAEIAAMPAPETVVADIEDVVRSARRREVVAVQRC